MASGVARGVAREYAEHEDGRSERRTIHAMMRRNQRLSRAWTIRGVGLGGTTLLLLQRLAPGRNLVLERRVGRTLDRVRRLFFLR